MTKRNYFYERLKQEQDAEKKNALPVTQKRDLSQMKNQCDNGVCRVTWKPTAPIRDQ